MNDFCSFYELGERTFERAMCDTIVVKYIDGLQLLLYSYYDKN
jgi:hypothetical protein